MARDFNGSSGTISSASTPVTGPPCTMGCFFYADSSTATGTLISVNDTGTATDCMRLDAAGATAGDPIRAESINGGTAAAAESTAGYATGGWHHAIGVFASATDRRAYYDGANKGTNSTSVTPTSIDRVAIGCTFRSSAVQ